MTDNYTHYEIRELKCHYTENINDMDYTGQEPIDPDFLFITPDGKRIAYSAVLREFQRVHDFFLMNEDDKIEFEKYKTSKGYKKIGKWYTYEKVDQFSIFKTRESAQNFLETRSYRFHEFLKADLVEGEVFVGKDYILNLMPYKVFKVTRNPVPQHKTNDELFGDKDSVLSHSE